MRHPSHPTRPVRCVTTLLQKPHTGSPLAVSASFLSPLHLTDSVVGCPLEPSFTISSDSVLFPPSISPPDSRPLLQVRTYLNQTPLRLLSCILLRLSVLSTTEGFMHDIHLCNWYQSCSARDTQPYVHPAAATNVPAFPHQHAAGVPSCTVYLAAHVHRTAITITRIWLALARHIHADGRLLVCAQIGCLCISIHHPPKKKKKKKDWNWRAATFCFCCHHFPPPGARSTYPSPPPVTYMQVVATRTIQMCPTMSTVWSTRLSPSSHRPAQ
jgi:hypothetical protein